MRPTLRRLAIVAMAAAHVVRADPESPQIRVRARARLEVTTTERTIGGIAVSGKLWDDDIGAGLGGRVVQVRLRGSGATLEGATATDPEGAFRIVFSAPIGAYTVEAGFSGDPGAGDYGGAPPIARSVDLARRPITLTLSAPERGSLGAPLPIWIEARDGAAPADLPILVTLGDGGQRASDEKSLTTVAGRARTSLVLPIAATPGTRLWVRARFDGDLLRDHALAERPLLVSSSTTLTATVGATPFHQGEIVRVTGQLSDATGPLAGQLVELLSDGEPPLAQGNTDGNGRFLLHLPTGRLALGQNRLFVRHRPPVSFRDPSRSPSLELVVLPVEPIPLPVLFLPPLLVALGLALQRLARRRDWGWPKRAKNRHADAAEPRQIAPGLVATRPGWGATFLRSADHGIDGVVWDAPFDRPVMATGTLVAIRAGGAEAGDEKDTLFTCDRLGRFTVEGLSTGNYAFTLAAPGYRAERFERALPHRGELRGVRIHLVPVRVEILAIFRRIAASWQSDPRLLETRTPRELCADVRSRGPLPAALGALTALVEETYYSPRIADECALAEAVRLAAELAPALLPARPTAPSSAMP